MMPVRKDTAGIVTDFLYYQLSWEGWASKARSTQAARRLLYHLPRPDRERQDGPPRLPPPRTTSWRRLSSCST